MTAFLAIFAAQVRKTSPQISLHLKVLPTDGRNPECVAFYVADDASAAEGGCLDV
jgi:hypothetical protein